MKLSFSRLPVYWKLSTIRCSIYAFISGASAFNAGVEGYTHLSDMTGLQKLKLAISIAVVLGGVWVAFLDQTLSKIKPPEDQAKVVARPVAEVQSPSPTGPSQ